MFTVTSLEDNLDDDGETTLREAIEQANANEGADEIVFASGLSGVIELDSDLGILPGITDDLIITGNGRSDTVIDGLDAVQGIFNARDGRITLQSMTVRNATGSGVFVDADAPPLFRTCSSRGTEWGFPRVPST